ncbi:uncharacterized protein Triagg1_905 [Trichoderma aggressivum f. europaeum]|uniref:Uncharacterized protein n=1 Tax=Trichoderma aggressivum f. europaeum TaxID=173218 RepID=A0AAE1M4J7_9HYPO|nr:hypothetical protein Triagg1_905 [Trichoderma aggressivum f. europaeum]
MNMVEQQQYIPAGLPHTGDLAASHGLSEARSIAPAGTSAYPEVAPFSAVSSFNIPAPCDSSLLTPISTTGSPPLHQIRKLAPQYPPPPSTPYTQVPTPPGSSKMYHQPWNNQFDMHNQNAPNGSPMNNQVPVASDFYMPEDRRTPNPPTEPYFGSFSVSEGPDTQSMHNQGQPSYYVPMEMGNQTSMMIREPRHMPMEPHPRDGSHPASLLVQPHSSHFANIRRASTDDRSYASRAETVRRSSSGSPRRRSATQGSTRVKKLRSSKRGGASLRSQVDPGDEHKNCYGQEIPPPIKKGCPEEERCIFESRWRHRSQRGQDMWDSIQGDFEKKFKKKHGKEMLQMKFKRGRSKYYDWLPEDVRILQAAWKKTEKERYQTMLNHFHEMGGSRNMLLSASDIEAKVVNDLKWEEAVYIDGFDECIRRRRKTIVKKRSTGRGEPGGDVPVSDEMLRISQTPHNEDDVINQVYGRRDRWDEDMASVNGEMMDSPLWENRAPMKMEPDTLVSSGGEHMARVQSNTNGHAIGIRPVPVYHPAPKAP